MTFSTDDADGLPIDPVWETMTEDAWASLELSPKVRLQASPSGELRSKIRKHFPWPPRDWILSSDSCRLPCNRTPRSRAHSVPAPMRGEIGRPAGLAHARLSWLWRPLPCRLAVTARVRPARTFRPLSHLACKPPGIRAIPSIASEKDGSGTWKPKQCVSVTDSASGCPWMIPIFSDIQARDGGGRFIIKSSITSWRSSAVETTRVRNFPSGYVLASS